MDAVSGHIGPSAGLLLGCNRFQLVESRVPMGFVAESCSEVGNGSAERNDKVLACVHFAEQLGQGEERGKDIFELHKAVEYPPIYIIVVKLALVSRLKGAPYWFVVHWDHVERQCFECMQDCTCTFLLHQERACWKENHVNNTCQDVIKRTRDVRKACCSIEYKLYSINFN